MMVSNVGFLPFGFIVPVMHKKMESFWKVSLLGFMFSLCVETIQLITKVGCFDVDDLMLNTLGAMIGYGAFRDPQVLKAGLEEFGKYLEKYN